MSVKVMLAPTLELARHVENPTLTVEAEYGSTVVEGRLYTAAHHQPAGSPYAGDHLVAEGRPSPCDDERIPFLYDGGIVLLSHIDLDSVGGVMRAMSCAPFHAEWDGESEPQPGQGWYFLFNRHAPFWRLAAFVDVRGPHRIGEWSSGIAPYVDEWARDMLRAYWAWSRTRPRFPRDTVTDVTEEIREHAMVLTTLLTAPQDDEERTALLVAGRQLAADEAALNAASFVRREEDVLLRESGQFVNALYADPDGRPARAVATLNTATGAVTISLAEPVEGVSCRAIVQALWGPDAGGHDGIAGSPRGRVMTGADLDAAAQALRRALNPPVCGHCGSAECERATGIGADCVALVRP